MRLRSVVSLLSILVAGGVGLAVSGLAACPLSHDAVETDRPCWDARDCVANERCAKPDGGALGQGRCAIPTGGPCFGDAGLGFYCFANAQGEPTDCFYDPQSRCSRCALDGGIPDGGCPDASCIEWQEFWGCR